MSGSTNPFGDLFERLRNQQEIQAQMPIVRYVPEMQQTFVQPAYMPQDMGYGAARFLSGPAMIPMSFDVPVPGYESEAFMPGDFRNFMAIASKSAPKGSSVIPVFDPNTGTYSKTVYTPPKA